MDNRSGISNEMASHKDKDIIKTILHYKKSLEVPQVDDKRVSYSSANSVVSYRFPFFADPSLLRSPLQALSYG